MIGAARARVAHSMPGRLRLRFAPREVDPESLATLLARLSGRPGIRSARYSPASGSIVVEYDPNALTEAALMGDLPPDAPPWLKSVGEHAVTNRATVLVIDESQLIVTSGDGEAIAGVWSSHPLIVMLGRSALPTLA